ncbi:MAG: SGNH/GDSL hydrolase family protein [Cyclobacteriaceae bacterium]|nr:SGNH/GDSL hydrolase family protein [Cyclobacteriaceae bacterium]
MNYRSGLQALTFNALLLVLFLPFHSISQGNPHSFVRFGQPHPQLRMGHQDDTIKQYTEVPGGSLDFSRYHHHRLGIRNSVIKFQQKKTGRVAFLGGSITHNGGWRDSICHYLQGRFPDVEFEFVNAGIPSMGSTPAAFRLERDILGAGPVDLLFEEAAVNDATNGRSSQEQIRAMEGIVRHVRRVNPATDIVIMHFADPPKMEAYRSGLVPEVILNHEKVAAHYGLPTINLAKEVTERIDKGEFTWEDDFIDLHPSPFGQGIYARSIISFLEKAWQEAAVKGDEILVYPKPGPLDAACYENGKLIPAEKAGIIQGWEMMENWKPEDGKGTRPNYVNVPMLTGQGENSLLEFRFSGNAVGIAVAAGPDAGIIEYQIDDSEWLTQDLFTEWSKSLHLPWYFTLGAALSDGHHTLKLRIRRDKNPLSTGTACRIRYFYVNASDTFNHPELD